MSKKARVQFIDVARGIAIILMIIGHGLDKGIARDIIFSFHMPLFIIISGLFYKEKTFKEEFKDLFFKLFIPMSIAIIVVTMIKKVPDIGFYKSYIDSLKTIFVGWNYEYKIHYSVGKVEELWFIYSLITIRLLFLINKKVSKKNELLLLLLVLGETYLGYLLGIRGYFLPWCFDISLASMIFYYFGYLLDKYKVLDKLISNYLLLLIILVIWIVGIKYNPIELAVRIYPNGLWSYITAICGSIIIIKISKIIDTYLDYIPYFLSWCGKNSLYILIGHYGEMNLIKYDLIKNKSLLIYLKICISFTFGAIIMSIYKLIDIIKKH